LVVWGAIRRIDGSLGGFFVFFPRINHQQQKP
jgi:hypothetical protein